MIVFLLIIIVWLLLYSNQNDNVKGISIKKHKNDKKTNISFLNKESRIEQQILDYIKNEGRVGNSTVVGNSTYEKLINYVSIKESLDVEQEKRIFKLINPRLRLNGLKLLSTKLEKSKRNDLIRLAIELNRITNDV